MKLSALPDHLDGRLPDVADQQFSGPVQKTEAGGAVGIDRKGVKDIRAYANLLDWLSVNSLFRIDLQIVQLKFGPAGHDVFNRHSIGDVLKYFVESFSIVIGDDIAVDFDYDLALISMLVEMPDVFDELIEVDPVIRKFLILFIAEAFDGNVDSIETGGNDFQIFFRTQ